MTGLLANLLLALAWLGVTGDFSLAGFHVGLLLGFLVLWLLGDVVGAGGYVRRVLAAPKLVTLFARELTVANLRVARDVVRPRLLATPAIVAVELEARTDVEVLLLSILVTMTPGTVVVSVTPDRSRMYVYAMYAADHEETRRRISGTFERSVLAITR